MGTIRVIILTNADTQFYLLLGPFLSRREIVTDLGFPVYDDPGKLWFVALADEQVAGFVGLRIEHDKAVFCSDYVLPVHRSSRIYDQLMAERLAYAVGKAATAQAVVTAAARPTYERYGFTPTGKRALKRYTQMARVLP